MLNRLFIIGIILIFCAGCGSAKGRSPVAIRIDEIEVTVDEFEEAYKNSYYAKDDSSASRNDFLGNLVMTKLILREAERLELDKEPSFLKDVEFFWQQSILKRMLEKKTKELALDLKVNENEVNRYYHKHQETDFQGRGLTEVYGQIQWILLKDKQQNVINDWMDSLEKKTKVDINYGLLNIEKD